MSIIASLLVREHDAKNLIRLLTRILFVWFIKQRDLVPHELFDSEALARDYLDDFDPDSRDTRYYKAILQNFFFAALNQTKGERGFRRPGSDHRDNMSTHVGDGGTPRHNVLKPSTIASGSNE